MKGTFSITQKELLPLLSSAQPICNKRTTLDITESILFHITPRELTLKATDMEISLQSNILVESNSEENTSFLILGKRIFDLVKEVEGEIEFKVEENQVKLKSKGVDLSLNIKRADEFPPFPERIENLMEMDSMFLLQLLNKIAFVIPQNNSNPALNGFLLEFVEGKMLLVSTDGYCLAKVETEKYTLPDDRKWLLPKRAALELKKILEGREEGDKVFFGVCGNQLVFSGKNFNFFTRLITDSFPQYKPILDKEGFLPAQLTRNSFLKTLKRSGCFLAGQFVPTNFSFEPGLLKINFHNKEVGKLDESIIIEEFEGKEIKSQFYSPYLLNGLQVFPKDKLKFYVKDSSRPIIFESNEDDYHFTYLVMPITP
jgi:DNA polymerase III subunit beta